MKLAVATLGAVALAGAVVQAQEPLGGQVLDATMDVASQLREAAIRLPLAGLLGAALALRPRRRGTPARSMPVIETQIILAIVGALIMLVIGGSLARAFGIVGAANLIRYRAKIDDPKDAVVMLSALAVGLASGVGLYALAIVGTMFVGAALWVIESFEPSVLKVFELEVKAKEDADKLRPRVEAILHRYHGQVDMRGVAPDELLYEVSVPADMKLDRVSEALRSLGDKGDVSVEWSEKKQKAS